MLLKTILTTVLLFMCVLILFGAVDTDNNPTPFLDVLACVLLFLLVSLIIQAIIWVWVTF